jgi:hypothetical protein
LIPSTALLRDKQKAKILNAARKLVLAIAAGILGVRHLERIPMTLMTHRGFEYLSQSDGDCNQNPVSRRTRIAQAGADMKRLVGALLTFVGQRSVGQGLAACPSPQSTAPASQ